MDSVQRSLLRSADRVSKDGVGSRSRNDRDRRVNVQVILRCRPLSEEEERVNTPVVVSCNATRREVCVVQNIGNKHIDSTFNFDKVFGMSSEQKDLFDEAISPIVNEVLEGYNCTIFAYGQTGTGKTYTMEGCGRGGGGKTMDGEFLSDVGVIPRAVQQIFDTLVAQNADYSMKVTFLELYNEEITDLLAPDESRLSDEKPKKPIALMEDGKGGVFARGLEEEIVCSASEIYRILDKGSSKRRTVETLLNKQSSRSHSIFSITIHIKECFRGEEHIKCGKFNLVDLAGSENILRSGAREGRAREAGEINKSLLTLGRCINALVDNSGHIPYRDSKLTRLLRDSLGGKTKTCIIATISPTIQCLEETLSTLDYAHRAKNIKNKPEVNQRMMKSEMLKDLYSEIDRLKQDVNAAREKNGVYVPRDRYMHEEAEKKAMAEKLERMVLLLELKDEQIVGLQDVLDSHKVSIAELKVELERTQRKLEDTEHELVDQDQRYEQAKSKIKEKEYLISSLLKSEKLLVEHAYVLHSELENAAADVSGLSSEIDCKGKIEVGNRNLIQRFHIELGQQLNHLHMMVSETVDQQENQLKTLEEGIDSFLSIKTEATEEINVLAKRLKDIHVTGINTLNCLSSELNQESQSTLMKLNSQVATNSVALGERIEGILQEADSLLKELQNSLSKQEENLAMFAQQQRDVHLRTVERTRFISRITENFFHVLDIHAFKLNMILGESQTIQDQQFSEFTKKYEESAAAEGSELLEKVADLLASSTARKKKLVQAEVDSVRKNTADRITNIQNEMSATCDFTSSFKEQWTSFVEEMEIHYHEDIASVESGTCNLEEGFQQCKTKARMGSQQWINAQHSLLSLGKDNVESVDSIVRSGMVVNQLLCARMSSASAMALGEADVANKLHLSSIDYSMKLDNDTSKNTTSLITPCYKKLRDLQSEHCDQIQEIIDNAGKCLEDEYRVDEPFCSSTKRSSVNLPSTIGIEELRTPALDDLVQTFYELNTASSKHVNGEVKQYFEAYEPKTPTTADLRVSLTT